MSRLRPGRAASRPAAAARPAAARRPGVFVQTPRSDIYVAMLGIALGAILLGWLLLVLVLNRYEFKVKATALATPSATTPAPLTGNNSTVHL